LNPKGAALLGTIARSAGQLKVPLRARFVATIFTGSFLLFLVQPMIARMALPRLGGAPAVWNSAMLVYQALLLAGYAYAHWLGRFRSRLQPAIHLAALILASLTLPIGLVATSPPPDANPFLWVPWLLLISVGPLFFVISAQAPLLQRWFAASHGDDPYPLYAASNLGSFAGLLAYPLIAEPVLAVSQQRWLWTTGYAWLVIFVAWCALRFPDADDREPVANGLAVPAWRVLAKWTVLAAVPSGLILSTTLHITTDLVAMPLLWVLPLGAYLLSFTIAFATSRWAAEWIARSAPFLLLVTCVGVFVSAGWVALFFGAVSMVNLFMLSVALHSQLFESRPPPQQLSLFYLALAFGGAVGGAFCALIAPLIFNWTYEHLLLLVAAAYLMRSRSPFDRFFSLWNGDQIARRLTIAGLVAVAALAIVAEAPAAAHVNGIALASILTIAIFAIGNRALFAGSLASLLLVSGGWERVELSLTSGMVTRSFFGIYSIRPGPYHSRMLLHGTTLHGIQNLGSAQRERMPTTYYAPASGVGLAMKDAPALFGPKARIALVGLGTGTLSCYARPGQHWTFYEIDPADVRIASDPRRFTFLSRCDPDARIEIGDARLLIERERPSSADLLVLDAFSSDSVPMHLLTRDAFAAYRRLLNPRGLLLIHISNRFLDLRPVVAAAAVQGGWIAALRRYQPDPAARARNEGASTWIALSQSPQSLVRLIQDSREPWLPLVPRHGFAPWTDDHASILPLISLSGPDSR
jgi:hypothetical protein